MPWRFMHIEEYFELIKANFIRCEECNENYFFDFLRHPRYFVSHVKACHLKNLLYRFNGHSEEENQRIRFGPRRKKDAQLWFSQLKSTEKRMISMQDNKWSEISEQECWACRLCNDGKRDLTQVFDATDVGKTQAFLHLRQCHEDVFDLFLKSLTETQAAAFKALWTPQTVHGHNSQQAYNQRRNRVASSITAGASSSHSTTSIPTTSTNRGLQQRIAEAERSRLRRLRATPEARQLEAQRSKKRRENMTPLQRQADYDRRQRKKKKLEESERSRKRRENATAEMKAKEVLRSRERRRNATDEQRKREALRSKMRRENATEDQKIKERERCRRRYELKKQQRKMQQQATAETDTDVNSTTANPKKATKMTSSLLQSDDITDKSINERCAEPQQSNRFDQSIMNPSAAVPATSLPRPHTMDLSFRVSMPVDPLIAMSVPSVSGTESLRPLPRPLYPVNQPHQQYVAMSLPRFNTPPASNRSQPLLCTSSPGSGGFPSTRPKPPPSSRQLPPSLQALVVSLQPLTNASAVAVASRTNQQLLSAERPVITSRTTMSTNSKTIPTTNANTS